MYNVWIGSYNSGDQAQGQLTVTTSNTLTAVAGSGGAPLNPAGNPNFGARSLAAGFGAVTIDVTSGGNIEARNSSAGSACRGYITAQPDVNVTLTTPVPSARIFIDNARDNADTTLVIQTPDGSYHCDDDTNGNSPQVDLSQATAGAYHIWVGSYQSGVQAHARLNITSGAAGAGGK
ncbi:MAG: hypothetical protein IPK60_20075 [Sandaracinaceae bacterium]|nr:hypothetical protein [Sandaracinaceae bacterium]